VKDEKSHHCLNKTAARRIKKHHLPYMQLPSYAVLRPTSS
jgi:hypothetical protein